MPHRLLTPWVAALAIWTLSSSVSWAQTPESNLVGIKQFNEEIGVALDLKGASEFALDPGECEKIIRAGLAKSRTKMVKGDYATPRIQVTISGSGSGGTGSYAVELAVTALIPSPFAEKRSVDAILWLDSERGEQHLRYDPASKELVNPPGSLRDRVYDALRVLSARLAAALERS